MYQRMLKLVRGFCDALIENQLSTGDRMDGGIMCPAFKTVNGRACDAIFPLYFMYLRSREGKYLTAARRLAGYAERTQLYDGSWISQETTNWKGTTVFKVLSLIHAYDLLGKNGMESEAEKLKGMIEKASRWTSKVFGEESIINNVNYFLTSATVLGWASRILSIPVYSEQGKKLIYKYGLGNLNKDGLLMGETTEKSIISVDIGYNLDMSLAVMAEYAVLTGDAAVKAETVRALKTHYCFMYPDGSVDNSFGCRSYKWTLFGGKTAHGCQIALCLLCDEEPAFARAADLNAAYLEGYCREGYLLGYGPDYHKYFDVGCIHSTFNRADAMAIAITYGKKPETEAAEIPSEKIFGFKSYPSINVVHVRTKGLMATVSGFATRNSPTGGALSYLWSNQAGPVQIGCTTEYDRSDEAQNMPEFPVEYKGAVTPRIELVCQDKKYGNLYEYDAKILTVVKDGSPFVTVLGNLKDENGGIGEKGLMSYRIDYMFGEDAVEKQYTVVLQQDCQMISITEPVVCSFGSSFEITDNGMTVSNGKSIIRMTGFGEGMVYDKNAAAGKILSVFPTIACLPAVWSKKDIKAGTFKFSVKISITSH